MVSELVVTDPAMDVTTAEPSMNSVGVVMAATFARSEELSVAVCVVSGLASVPPTAKSTSVDAS